MNAVDPSEISRFQRNLVVKVRQNPALYRLARKQPKASQSLQLDDPLKLVVSQVFELMRNGLPLKISPAHVSVGVDLHIDDLNSAVLFTIDAASRTTAVDHVVVDLMLYRLMSMAAYSGQNPEGFGGRINFLVIDEFQVEATRKRGEMNEPKNWNATLFAPYCLCLLNKIGQHILVYAPLTICEYRT